MITIKDYSFETLKSFADNYIVYENHVESKADYKSTSFDPKIVRMAQFAQLWQSCPELPREEVSGLKDISSKTCPEAWSEDSKEVYDAMITQVTSLPNFSVTTTHINDEVKKCSSGHKDDLFNNLFFNPTYMKGSTEDIQQQKAFINSFFKDAFESSKQSKQSDKAATFS